MWVQIIYKGLNKLWMALRQNENNLSTVTDILLQHNDLLTEGSKQDKHTHLALRRVWWAACQVHHTSWCPGRWGHPYLPWHGHPTPKWSSQLGTCQDSQQAAVTNSAPWRDVLPKGISPATIPPSHLAGWAIHFSIASLRALFSGKTCWLSDPLLLGVVRKFLVYLQ